MRSIAVFWNGFVLNGAKHWYIGHYLISKSVKLGSSKDIYLKVRVLFWVRIKWPIQPVISFYNMKPLRIWRDAILLQGYTPAFPKQFLGSHWHTRVERGALRKESRPWIRPGLEPRLHDPVSEWIGGQLITNTSAICILIHKDLELGFFFLFTPKGFRKLVAAKMIRLTASSAMK